MQLAAQRIDFLHNVLWHCRGPVADKNTKNRLVLQALFDRNRNFAAQLYVFALAGPVHCAVADCKAVHPRFLNELYRAQGVRISAFIAENMVFHTRQHPKFSLYGDPALMRVFDDLTGQFNILFKRQAAAIDHNTGVTAGNRRFDTVKITPVVKVQCHRYRALCGKTLDCFADIQRATALILQRGIHKIGAPTHKPVCKVCTL
ncbi:hypothetical protein SDC9_121084 [bioreactor metagenome]|uniref:Uncharacterized protein n=1 Tax=bioreactor metagenome TaxID=1076179 RepID=A0A645CAY8_9ZZZZ